jgi:hypothetical protein
MVDLEEKNFDERSRMNVNSSSFIQTAKEYS